MITLRRGQRGPEVSMLQLALNRAGFNTGEIDGIFGTITHNAVVSFQSSRNLVQDGIVGTNTWNALRPYLVGYISYRIMTRGYPVQNFKNIRNPCTINVNCKS